MAAAGQATSRASARWSRTRIALAVALAPVLFAVAIVAVLVYAIFTVCLHLAIWTWWCPRGRDVLFVYSDGPIWREYIDDRIIPRLGTRAVVLNWSQRKQWRPSLARVAFHHFGGSREFNPLAVVFRPFRRTRTFRFWQPFRDLTHGRPAALHAMEREFFGSIGIRRPNEYSAHWFAAFMDTMPDHWTAIEVDGVCRRLPLPACRRVLDVCCGPGRHAAGLSERGYEVTGIDRDEAALSRARRRAPAATFLQLDQRDLSAVAGPFDAAVILWQSFGHFDRTTNDRILSDLAALLRPGGRLLLDLFHPEPLIAERGAPVRSARAEGVVITNVVESGRLESRIQYPDGASETMSFELFTPAALIERAGPAGFRVIEQCCWWDEARPPDPTVHRYQSVFERKPPD